MYVIINVFLANLNVELTYRLETIGGDGNKFHDARRFYLLKNNQRPLLSRIIIIHALIFFLNVYLKKMSVEIILAS